MDAERAREAEPQGAQSNVNAVVSHLQERWNALFRLTTIKQAMDALGLPKDDALRLAIGDILRTQPNVHPAVERWGPLAFILTEDKKRLARFLVQRAVDRRGKLAPAVVAQAIGWSEPDVAHGLNVLRQVGLLDWRGAGDAIAYSVAVDWQQRAGPLGFTFHTVQLEDGERFNVP